MPQCRFWCSILVQLKFWLGVRPSWQRDQTARCQAVSLPIFSSLFLLLIQHFQVYGFRAGKFYSHVCMQVALYTAGGTLLQVIEARDALKSRTPRAAAFNPSGQGFLIGSQGALVAFSKSLNDAWALSQTMEARTLFKDNWAHLLQSMACKQRMCP